MFGFNAFSFFPISTLSITGTFPPVNPDTHDGFTKKEIKRYKRIKKELADAENKRLAEYKQKQLDRKKLISDIVDPKPTIVKKNKVELKQEVTVDIPSIDLTQINETIYRLERQQKLLLEAVAHRQRLARVEMELAILEAKRQAEEDDEQALLLLL